MFQSILPPIPLQMDRQSEKKHIRLAGKVTKLARARSTQVESGQVSEFLLPPRTAQINASGRPSLMELLMLGHL